MLTLPTRRAGRPRRVLLVGFQDQDNLGLRYLCSAVRAARHEPDIMTFGADPLALIARARSTRADVIGPSLIFQYMTPTLAGVIPAVSEAGVKAHTAVIIRVSTTKPSSNSSPGLIQLFALTVKSRCAVAQPPLRAGRLARSRGLDLPDR